MECREFHFKFQISGRDLEDFFQVPVYSASEQWIGKRGTDHSFRRSFEMLPATFGTSESNTMNLTSSTDSVASSAAIAPSRRQAPPTLRSMVLYLRTACSAACKSADSGTRGRWWNRSCRDLENQTGR